MALHWHQALRLPFTVALDRKVPVVGVSKGQNPCYHIKNI